MLTEPLRFNGLSINDHIGDTWYVAPAALGGSDSNNGKSPNFPFLTITYAISQAAAGDQIIIAGGDYTESVTVNKDYLTLRGQVGAIIFGTLTASSNHYVLDTLVVYPTAAVGMALSGNFGVIKGTRVIGTPTSAYVVTGFNNLIVDSYAFGYSVVGYDVSEGNTLRQAITALPAGAARGFRINASAYDGCLLEDCISAGNSISGYEVGSSTTACILKNCSSGSGDGPLVDNGGGTTWPGYTFDDEIIKEITFAGTSIHNLFEVTGSVRLSDFYGEVTTVIPATVSNLHLEVYSTNGTEDITDSPGVNISGLVAGALLVRNTVSTENIDVANPSGGPATAEVLGTGAVNPPSGTSIDIVADPGATTYVRVNCSAALASGAIKWHCRWRPLGTGFLRPV